MGDDTADFTRYIKNVLHDNRSSNVSKKLPFGDSFENHGKSKPRSLDEEQPNFPKRSKDESIMESPWEIKRVRSSLTIAKNEIAQLQDYIEKQHSLRKEMETLFSIEKEHCKDKSQ
ncbi:uncharacterized protein LOC113366872 [Ctenocephalides felis]|uniref:uncharacterized protein LOC113366872 n=1 Tax=Ctenocephalides felis TaxID=7515 RepID=UPI000E6E390D|nr:uncharacterized protein LOC113366872 [Ctenocephalides felis]